jgi:gliding motility-associated lipoprotein GldD
MYRFRIFILLILVAGNSCRPHVFTPKPPGYFKIDTPAKHEYMVFERAGFPYSFEYPVYSVFADDTVYQSGKERNPYWVNIYFPGLGAVLNITYKEITKEHPYMDLVIESDDLSFFHHEKGTIEPYVFRINDRNVSGIMYTILGNVATRYQFTATDSVKHFIRGALYFNVTPNADSLQPATDFLEKDIKHMLESLRWH